MDDAKRSRLEAAGWKFGDYAEFLGLTEAEREQVELRSALSREIRRLRVEQGLTLRALGRRIGSTQAEAARAESGVGGASLDLMFRAFFELGGKLAGLVGAATPSPPAVNPPAPRRAGARARSGG